MKQVISISLILIHLFNVIGYYGFFVTLEALNDKNVQRHLNSDAYAGSETITLRLPLNLPYPPNYEHDNYERVNGKFTHEGEVYRLVKQKLYNDTLYIVCVKDKKGKEIEAAYENLAQTFTDKPADAKPSTGKFGNLPVKDFDFCRKLNLQPEFYLAAILSFNFVQTTYPDYLVSSIDHPPRA